MAPFLIEAWLITWIISARVRLAKSAGISVPLIRASRLILYRIVFVKWLGWASPEPPVAPAATMAHDQPWASPWLGPTVALTASITTLYRWVTVSTSEPPSGWPFFPRAVNKPCISFARPRAMPYYPVGTRATRPSRRPQIASVLGYGPLSGGPIGFGRYWGSWLWPGGGPEPPVVGSISGGLLTPGPLAQ